MHVLVEHGQKRTIERLSIELFGCRHELEQVVANFGEVRVQGAPVRQRKIPTDIVGNSDRVVQCVRFGETGRALLQRPQHEKLRTVRGVAYLPVERVHDRELLHPQLAIAQVVDELDRSRARIRDPAEQRRTRISAASRVQRLAHGLSEIRPAGLSAVGASSTPTSAAW